MPKKYYLLVLFFAIVSQSFAQHVRVRLDFPVGASVRPVGGPPHSGTVWIGPEWRWQGGQYVPVPGYWGKPKRFGAVWVPGHWRHTRRGYIWVPGRWR